MMRDYDIQWGVVSIPAGSAFTPFTIYKLGSCMLCFPWKETSKNIVFFLIFRLEWKKNFALFLCMNYKQRMFRKFKKEIHSCESNSEQNSEQSSAYNIL